MNSAPTPFDMINDVNDSRDDNVKITNGLKLYTNEATPVTPIKDLKGHINKKHGLVSNDEKIRKMDKKVQSLLGLRDLFSIRNILPILHFFWGWSKFVNPYIFVKLSKIC